MTAALIVMILSDVIRMIYHVANVFKLAHCLRFSCVKSVKKIRVNFSAITFSPALLNFCSALNLLVLRELS